MAVSIGRGQRTARSGGGVGARPTWFTVRTLEVSKRCQTFLAANLPHACACRAVPWEHVPPHCTQHKLTRSYSRLATCLPSARGVGQSNSRGLPQCRVGPCLVVQYTATPSADCRALFVLSVRDPSEDSQTCTPKCLQILISLPKVRQGARSSGSDDAAMTKMMNEQTNSDD